jgi:hypothetical protein
MTEKRILGCLRVPPVEYHCSRERGREGEGSENLVYPPPWDFKTSFTCRKFVRHGTSGFTSHPKEVVLRIFITLKNPSPWLRSNPQPLGPVASTLTTTPLGPLPTPFTAYQPTVSVIGARLSRKF